MPDTTSNFTEMKERLHEAREQGRAARDSVVHGIEALLPAGFVEHRRAARREMLLALRSLIDGILERGERP